MIINIKGMAIRHSVLITLLMLVACGHKTDLRLPTAEEKLKQTEEAAPAVLTRQPVNRGATSLPPVPRF